jgi:hypothetical protein
VDGDAAAEGGGVAGDHVEGGHVAGAFEAGDDGLGGAQAVGDFGLGSSGVLTRLDHFADDGEDGAEAFVFRFNLRVGEEGFAEGGEAGRAAISLAWRRIIPGSTVRSAFLG